MATSTTNRKRAAVAAPVTDKKKPAAVKPAAKTAAAGTKAAKAPAVKASAKKEIGRASCRERV